MHLYVLFMGSLGNALNVNVLKARLCSSCRMRVHACIVWYAAICIEHGLRAYCIYTYNAKSMVYAPTVYTYNGWYTNKV